MNKEDLIGGTVPRLREMNHSVDSIINSREFELPGAVGYLFCSGCNSLYELSKDEEEDLESRLGKKRSSDSQYFEVDGGIDRLTSSN